MTFTIDLSPAQTAEIPIKFSLLFFILFISNHLKVDFVVVGGVVGGGGVGDVISKKKNTHILTYLDTNTNFHQFCSHPEKQSRGCDKE